MKFSMIRHYLSFSIIFCVIPLIVPQKNAPAVVAGATGLAEGVESTRGGRTPPRPSAPAIEVIRKVFGNGSDFRQNSRMNMEHLPMEHLDGSVMVCHDHPWSYGLPISNHQKKKPVFSVSIHLRIDKKGSVMAYIGLTSGDVTHGAGITWGDRLGVSASLMASLVVLLPNCLFGGEKSQFSVENDGKWWTYHGKSLRYQWWKFVQNYSDTSTWWFIPRIVSGL